MAKLPSDPQPERYPEAKPETLEENAESPPHDDDDLNLGHETAVRVEEAREESLTRFPG